MKKLTALLLALVMGLSLVACGGVDTQPAINAYNELSKNYNEFVALGNENLDAISAEDIEFFNNVAATIEEYGAKLESGAELTQEEVDEMVEMFEELNGVIEESLDAWEE